MRQCMVLSDVSTEASWNAASASLPDHYPPLPPLFGATWAAFPQVWLPGHVIISGTVSPVPAAPTGRVQQRYIAPGLDTPLDFAGGVYRPHLAAPWLHAGAHFRVPSDSEPGVLRLDAENAPLSYLHCGAPGSTDSLANECGWADNWTCEILSRVPVRLRRRAAVLLALSAIRQAARRAGRVLRTTLRHASTPLWEYIRSDSAA